VVIASSGKIKSHTFLEKHSLLSKDRTVSDKYLFKFDFN
jgi:hypothetical protein